MEATCKAPTTTINVTAGNYFRGQEIYGTQVAACKGGKCKPDIRSSALQRNHTMLRIT